MSSNLTASANYTTQRKPMCDVLVWSFDAITGIRWPEVVSALATVATAAIAFLALRNWKRQDKAKREAEFLDALIETAHTYIADIQQPISILQIAKIGMECHAPTWENSEQVDIAVKGAIGYIQTHGEQEAKRLSEALMATQPSVIKLRSLAAKGQVFNFEGYAKCSDAVAMLTWQFERMEAFMAVVRSPTSNWENPEVMKSLRTVMTIDADEMRECIKQNNVALLEFSGKTYRRIYG